MANYIFPLLYKPGISRDGTDFEPFFCREGNWVRFDEGRVKNIGGMQAPELFEPLFANGDPISISDVRVLPNKNTVEKVCVLYAGGYDITRVELSMDFCQKFEDSVSDELNLENITVHPEPLWYSEEVIDNGVERVAYLLTNTGRNIADSTQGRLFSYDLATHSPREINGSTYDQRASGGLVFAAPFLFLYGENGFVQYSTSTNIFAFANDEDQELVGARSLTISHDKVVYGRSIRGGTNSPALLFWTLSTVVRIVNVGQVNEANFQVDVISNSSTIMSSRCVIEYDGLFFWIGTDRFYTYNGIVQAMEKVGSLNYFFDNVDTSHKQLIFGVRNTRWGELWWFYPEKGQEPGKVRNTRAIIFNKEESTWYDTAISRDAGYFSRDFGFMVTVGPRIGAGADDNMKGIWRHEVGAQERVATEGKEIESYVDTPIISIKAFNPKDNLRGIDRAMDLAHMEPDILMDDDNAKMGLRIITTRYAQSKDQFFPPLNEAPISFDRTTEKIDLRIQSWNIRFRFISTVNFKLGNIMLSVNIGDGN